MSDSIEGCKYKEYTLAYDEFNLKSINTNIDTQNINLCNVQKCILVNKLDNLNEITVRKYTKNFEIKINNYNENC